MITSHGLASAIGSVAELARSESHETLLVSLASHEAAAAYRSVPSSVRVRLRAIVLSPPSVLRTDICSSSANTRSDFPRGGDTQPSTYAAVTASRAPGDGTNGSWHEHSGVKSAEDVWARTI
eukprot:scaffold31862_cov63-Phaeocystis_antarctica.AAC.13